MRTKLARLTVEELHEIKWLTGGLLALLAVWSLSALDLGLELHVLFCGMAIAVALLRPAWMASAPPKVWIWAGPLMLFVVLADFIVSMPLMIPPLVRMVMLLLLYRALAKRQKREDLQLVLLCLFCLVISGTLTVSLLFAFQILLFAPFAMAFLFVVCLLDRGPVSAPIELSWKHFGWGRLVQRIGQVLDLRVLVLGGLLYCFIMVVSSFLFVLIPRFNLEQAIPLLQIGTKARSGFSDEVELGEVSEISEDNSVALRVDVPSLEALDTSPYWRMLVLDMYADGGFRMSPGLRTKFSRHQSAREVFGQRSIRYVPENERWTFYLEGGISRYLPVPGPFRRMRFQSTQEFEEIECVHVFGTDMVRQSVFFYQLEDFEWARRLAASEVDREGLAQLTDGSVAMKPEYPFTTLGLVLDEAEQAELAELNAEITQDAVDLEVSRYSQLVTDYLWQHFNYSLSPNGTGGSGDPVVNWLRKGDRGHCELFAASLILLARQAGYPARMVVGFTGGTWNSVEEYFVIRNRDAHAWVEIYDARSSEWLRVDPTPGSGSSDPEVRVRGGMEFESGWAAWIDSLRIQWYRRIVNFDEQDQMDMAISVKDAFNEMKEDLLENLKAKVEQFKAILKQPLKELPFVYMFVVLLVGAALIVFWRFRFVVLRWVSQLLKRPEALDPVRQQAGRYLARIKARQAEGGAAIPDTAQAMREQLEAVRFGPRVGEAQARAIFKQARHVLRGIR